MSRSSWLMPSASGWYTVPSFTRTAHAVQQPMRHAYGSSRPLSSASQRMYLWVRDAMGEARKAD